MRRATKRLLIAAIVVTAIAVAVVAYELIRIDAAFSLVTWSAQDGAVVIEDMFTKPVSNVKVTDDYMTGGKREWRIAHIRPVTRFFFADSLRKPEDILAEGRCNLRHSAPLGLVRLYPDAPDGLRTEIEWNLQDMAQASPDVRAQLQLLSETQGNEWLKAILKVETDNVAGP